MSDGHRCERQLIAQREPHRSCECPPTAYLPSAAIDAARRRYFTGRTEHAARLGTAELPGGAGFLAAIEADGNTAWVLPLQGSTGTGVALSGAGDMLLVGTMHDHVEVAEEKRTRASIGALELSCVGDALSGLVARVDRDGKPLWATPVCAAPGGSVGRLAVAADPAGNSFVVGEFTKQVAFGKHTLSAPSDAGNLPRSLGFMARVDSHSEPQWVVPVSGEGSVTMIDLAMDGDGNGYAGAVLTGKTTVGDKVVSPAGAHEALVAQLDTTGTLVWATELRGSETETTGLAVAAEPTAGMRGGNPGVWPNRLRLDAAGNAYVVGTIKGAVWLGCDQLGSANRGLFLWKVGQVL